jgi:tetratricopeptide (TPR) repeat protein
MKRTGYLGISLLLLLILVVSALPGLGQAAQANQPRAKTQPEYNAYLSLYNEKDPAKKAELGEKFITDFKESDFVPNAYKMLLQAYAAQKNWAKVLDAADRATALPMADNGLKGYAYGNAMIAAQNMNDMNKVISYGEKVLVIDPNDLNTLITLSAVIPQKNPSDKAQLDRAAEMATKALAGIQPMMAKASPQEKPQLVQIDGTLHGTLGLIAYNKQDYAKSIQEYQTAIMDNMKEDTSHYFLAYDYIALMGQASKEYVAAVKNENDAKAAKADQPTIDDLAAKRSDFEDKIKKNRDQVIDELAIAVAINGPVAAQAKAELTKQWTAKNDGTAGLDEFIEQKKAQLK